MKLNLPENYIYAGKHYGPGEVDIEDEKAYTAIKGKIDAAAKAAADTPTPVAAAEDETQAANRAAAEQAEADRLAAEKRSRKT